MHFKYAAILNTVWVTFMFGLALPLLFPIAAFTFFNYYLCEKLLLTYYYQRPPSYDEKLNSTALAWAKYAPLLMMAFGYWTMGNKQIFSNVIVPLEFTSRTLGTDHSGDPDLGQELPLFIVGCCMLVYFFVWSPIVYFFRTKGYCRGGEDEDVDEDLGTYFQCVSPDDRKRWVAEEVYNRHKLGINTMTDKTLEKLRTVKSKERVIAGTPNYEILSNDKYIASF